MLELRLLKESSLSILSSRKKIHFIGIGGYGMSALAQVLLIKGYQVSGSDIKESVLTKTLATAGAKIFIGHHSQNLSSADLVVYSTAIAADNPELQEAAYRNLPLWHRSELLAALLNNAYGIAIAGAHGKTTTTAMVALLLEAAGLDPTAIVGGVVPAFGSNARIGAGRYLVAEADESDRSFSRYFPRIALVTGIEADHLEHYANDYSRLKAAYREFLSHLPQNDGLAVLCADDPALAELSRELSCKKIYYSLNFNQEEAQVTKAYCADKAKDQITENLLPAPDYYAAAIQLKPDSSTFAFCHRDKTLLPAVTLAAPGLHNVSNAVGALSVAAALDLDLEKCGSALTSFTGAGRRFELIGEVNEIKVIDDYAHHPTEIRATLKAARLSGSRVLCLFQPHRYSRTANLFQDFTKAFADADRLYLHEIYPAGEAPLPGISGEALATAINRESGLPVFFNPNIKTLEKQVAADAQPGDLIITMGAGDITYSAPRILNYLQERPND